MAMFGDNAVSWYSVIDWIGHHCIFLVKYKEKPLCSVVHSMFLIKDLTTYNKDLTKISQAALISYHSCVSLDPWGFSGKVLHCCVEFMVIDYCFDCFNIYVYWFESYCLKLLNLTDI